MYQYLLYFRYIPDTLYRFLVWFKSRPPPIRITPSVKVVFSVVEEKRRLRFHACSKMFVFLFIAPVLLKQYCEEFNKPAVGGRKKMHGRVTSTGNMDTFQRMPRAPTLYHKPLQEIIRSFAHAAAKYAVDQKLSLIPCAAQCTPAPTISFCRGMNTKLPLSLETSCEGCARIISLG